MPRLGAFGDKYKILTHTSLPSTRSLTGPPLDGSALPAGLQVCFPPTHHLPLDYKFPVVFLYFSELS